jgi:hypothetical protein
MNYSFLSVSINNKNLLNYKTGNFYPLYQSYNWKGICIIRRKNPQALVLSPGHVLYILYIVNNMLYTKHKYLGMEMALVIYITPPDTGNAAN